MFALPTPKTAPLTGGPRLRWGIIAPGWIATRLAATVRANTDQDIVAVASSSAERAAAFARQFDIARHCDSYAALVADPDVDAVYVASLNHQHIGHAMLAIEAGKHVLIEKPVGVSADEARQIRDAAQRAGVLAMEAMWTRFLPQTDVILQLRDAGAFGEIGIVQADFCERFDPERAARVFSPTVGGGALLDIGIYPLSFAQFLLGDAEAFAVTGTLTEGGVDATTIITQSYASGARSVAVTSLELGPAQGAEVIGSKARASFTEPFFVAGGFDLIVDGERHEWRDPNGLTGHDGLCYQVTAFAQHVADGLTDSPLRPFADTIAILEIIDEARRQIGAIAPER